VSDLSQIKIEFLRFFVSKRLFFWILAEIVPRTEMFPKSMSLFVPLVTQAMNTPEVAYVFIQELYRTTLSFFQWTEMMKYVRVINNFKKDYSDILTRVFWSETIIRETVKSFQESPECFPALCKFMSLFIKDMPAAYNSHLLTYILSSYNCYTYILAEKPDSPPTPEDLASMEEDMDTILQVLCSPWQTGAINLFNALVNEPVCSEEGAIEMVVKSVPVHKVITRVFEEGMAALPSLPPDYANNARRCLLGMAIAYIAMCSPEMKSLPEFIEKLRGHLALGPTDPLISFDALSVAHAIVYLTVQTSCYTPEAESLLAACFAKSAPFEVSDKFISFVSQALRIVSGPSPLQKLFILCNSPILARSIGSLVKPFLQDVFDSDEATKHYVAAISQLLTQPPPPSTVSVQEQHDPVIKQQAVPEIVSAPSTDALPTNGMPPSDSDSVPHKQEKEDDDDDEHQPMGLPPSEPTDMA